MALPQAGWKLLGSSPNADFYEVRADILAVIPHADTHDDAFTARASLDFQRQHWQRVGHRGAVVVFMDRVLEQDAGARSVYANETHDLPTTCYALIGEGFFAQAASAVFTGLARPGVPTEVFVSLVEAMPFIERMNDERGGDL